MHESQPLPAANPIGSCVVLAVILDPELVGRRVFILIQNARVGGGGQNVLRALSLGGRRGRYHYGTHSLCSSSCATPRLVLLEGEVRALHKDVCRRVASNKAASFLAIGKKYVSEQPQELNTIFRIFEAGLILVVSNDAPLSDVVATSRVHAP